MCVEFPELEPLTAGGTPAVIAGPCSAETEEQVMDTACALAAGGVTVFRAGLWKPRTMPGCFDGVGERGLPWMERVKAETGMALATEVAIPEHAAAALDAGIDILWLGARTVSDPFAVQRVADCLAARPEKPAVLVKNPLSPDIDLWTGALLRIYNAGVRRLGAVHRGFCTYGRSEYRNDPLWSVPFELRRRYPSLPLLCDPSHIAGRRGLVEQVAARALDMGFDGLIVESHCRPEAALSDAAQQLTPGRLLQFMAMHPAVRAAEAPADCLDELRARIDAVDAELIDLLARRMAVSAEIGRMKKDSNMTAVQPRRFNDMMSGRLAAGAARGLDPTFLSRLWTVIHEESVRCQTDVMLGDTPTDGAEAEK